MSLLKSLQQTEVPKIVSQLEKFFDQELKKAAQKDQVLVDSVQVLKEFCLRGGKRIRPLLTIVGYQIAQQVSGVVQPGNIYRAACAVETHHLYVLNLDDMADRDVLRHGGKTLEEYYKTEVFQNWPDKNHHGQTFSSITGSLLNSFTFELLRTSGFDSQTILDAEGIVTDALFADTIVGWQIHYFQNNELISQSTEEQFLKGLEYVTSRYTFVGPLTIGVTLALSEKNGHFLQLKQMLTEYGIHVGIAFQIQDDILGLFGDPKETGKAVGNDVREGKKTLLMQVAYRKGNKQQKKIIEESLNHKLTKKKLKELQQVVIDTGSLDYSRELAREHVKKGIDVLRVLPDSVEGKKILEELAMYMIERKK